MEQINAKIFSDRPKTKGFFGYVVSADTYSDGDIEFKIGEKLDKNRSAVEVLVGGGKIGIIKKKGVDKWLKAGRILEAVFTKEDVLTLYVLDPDELEAGEILRMPEGIPEG